MTQEHEEYHGDDGEEQARAEADQADYEAEQQGLAENDAAGEAAAAEAMN